MSVSERRGCKPREKEGAREFIRKSGGRIMTTQLSLEYRRDPRKSTFREVTDDA